MAATIKKFLFYTPSSPDRPSDSLLVCTVGFIAVYWFAQHYQPHRRLLCLTGPRAASRGPFYTIWPGRGLVRNARASYAFCASFLPTVLARVDRATAAAAATTGIEPQVCAHARTHTRTHTHTLRPGHLTGNIMARLCGAGTRKTDTHGRRWAGKKGH